MRKLIITLATLVALIAVMPIALGILAKHRLLLLAEHLSQDNDLIITVENYQLGYWHSQADINITLKIPAAIKEVLAPQQVPNEITLHERKLIQHGPIIRLGDINNKTHTTYLATAAISQPIMSESVTAQADLLILIDGSYRLLLHANTQQSSANDNKTPTITGFNVQYDIAHQFQQVNVKLTVADFSFNSVPLHIAAQIKDLAITAEFHKDNRLSWIGDYNIAVNKLQGSLYDAPFLLDNVSLVSATHIKSNTLNKSFLLNMQKISFLDTSIGPGSINLQANNLYLPAYMSFLQHLFNYLFLQAPTDKNALAQQQLQLEQQLMGLMQTSPKITIQLQQLHVANGYVDVSGVLSRSMSANSMLLFTEFDEWIDSWQLDFNVTLSNNILENYLLTMYQYQLYEMQHSDAYYAKLSQDELLQLAQSARNEQILQWLTAGIIILGNDNQSYTFHFQYDNGVLKMNGKIMPE